LDPDREKRKPASAIGNGARWAEQNGVAYAGYKGGNSGKRQKQLRTGGEGTNFRENHLDFRRGSEPASYCGGANSQAESNRQVERDTELLKSKGKLVSFCSQKKEKKTWAKAMHDGILAQGLYY